MTAPSLQNKPNHTLDRYHELANNIQLMLEKQSHMFNLRDTVLLKKLSLKLKSDDCVEALHNTSIEFSALGLNHQPILDELCKIEACAPLVIEAQTPNKAILFSQSKCASKQSPEQPKSSFGLLHTHRFIR